MCVNFYGNLRLVIVCVCVYVACLKNVFLNIITWIDIIINLIKLAAKSQSQ